MSARVRAIYDFAAENVVEMSISVGDEITVLSRDDPGWWLGECRGRKGLFPSNYTEPVYKSTDLNSPPLPQATHRNIDSPKLAQLPPPIQGRQSETITNGLIYRKNVNEISSNNNGKFNGNSIEPSSPPTDPSQIRLSMNNQNEPKSLHLLSPDSALRNHLSSNGLTISTSPLLNNQQHRGSISSSNTNDHNTSPRGSVSSNGSVTSPIRGKASRARSLSPQMGPNTPNKSPLNRYRNSIEDATRPIQYDIEANRGQSLPAHSSETNSDNQKLNEMSTNNRNSSLVQKTEKFLNDNQITHSDEKVQIIATNTANPNELSDDVWKTATPFGRPLSGAVINGTGPASSIPTVQQVKKGDLQNTRFGLWSYQMAITSALTSIVLGCMGLMWWKYESRPLIALEFDLYCGIYSIGLGFIVTGVEYYWGRNRTRNRIPIRALLYAVVCGFEFLSWPTMLSGIFFLNTAVLNFIACYKREAYTSHGKRFYQPKANPNQPEIVNLQVISASTETNSRSSMVGPIDEQMNPLKFLFYIVSSARQQNKLGHICFMTFYVAVNVALFAWYIDTWFKKVQTLKDAASAGLIPKAAVVSDYTPWAKGFGILLDFNCALILLPICRSLLRSLYNRSTSDHGWISRSVRAILYVIPLDDNLEFHRLIANVILFAGFMHTLSHYMNFAVTPDAALAAFQGSWPLLSGGIICWIMLILYTATAKSVRNGQFEIFWYCHHMFLPFFVITLVHGRGGLNPNFWKFFILPGVLYILERLLRIYRASKEVVLVSVTLMDDVFSLEFSKQGVFEEAYREGQYLFLQCPLISSIQWHPFTISSAPEEKTVTVHIRMLSENSWTRQVATLIGSMGPKGVTYFELERNTPAGKCKGKILGPDGKTQLLCVDGPYSAPTQHIGEYSTVLVIGAGIGSTPLSSTLRSVVFHRWKYSIGQAFPDNAYFVWICSHKDIDAFRWLIRAIKEAQDEVVHMRENARTSMVGKTFEFHIFITSIPKDQKPIDVVVDDEIGFWGVPRTDELVEKMHANWDEADLYKLMKCPPDEHTQLEDIHVYKGRPNWNKIFEPIKLKHHKHEIGVLFCGAPQVVKDLEKQCYRENATRQPNALFKLHKENF